MNVKVPKINKVVPIVRPSPGESIEGVIVCGRPVSSLYHYFSGSTLECPRGRKQAASCPLCVLGVGVRYRVHFGVYGFRAHKHIICETGAVGAQNVRQAIDDDSISLAGRRCRFTRLGRGPRGAVEAWIDNELVPIAQYRAMGSFDLGEVLDRIYAGSVRAAVDGLGLPGDLARDLASSCKFTVTWKKGGEQ